MTIFHNTVRVPPNYAPRSGAAQQHTSAKKWTALLKVVKNETYICVKRNQRMYCKFVKAQVQHTSEVDGSICDAIEFIRLWRLFGLEIRSAHLCSAASLICALYGLWCFLGGKMRPIRFVILFLRTNDITRQHPMTFVLVRAEIKIQFPIIRKTICVRQHVLYPNSNPFGERSIIEPMLYTRKINISYLCGISMHRGYRGCSVTDEEETLSPPN